MNGDTYKKMIFDRTGIEAKDLSCPREKTSMTPCVARSGNIAMTECEKCVGCGESVRALIHDENQRKKYSLNG